MPNSCKSNIRFDPNYTFHLPVTMVPECWFRSIDEMNGFYKQFQADKYTLRWPELIDSVNSHYPVEAAKAVHPEANRVGEDWQNVPV